MAKITGSKTTKAAETASLRQSRTRHRVGVGQLFIQPTAHADRLAAASGIEVEERAAIDFITGPAPVEAQAAMVHVRPTAPYMSKSAPVEEVATVLQSGQALVKVGEQQWTVLVGPGLATEKQAQWMMDIAHRPSITDEMRFSLRVRLQQGFARTAASAFITKYKDIPAGDPKVTNAPEAPKADYAGQPSFEKDAAPAVEVKKFHSGTPQVEAGRYAVEEDGVLKFFRVTKGKGRWAGRTFVEIQASENRYAVRLPQRRDAILATIAENPLAAQVRYGQEIGKCYACGRTLTDATSRSLGIGPDCRAK